MSEWGKGSGEWGVGERSTPPFPTPDSPLPKLELELKAVVAEPPAVRQCLLRAGASRRFAGVMQDQRFDRDGELGAKGEVLRLRTFLAADGTCEAVLAWKGPTTVAPGGYKQRAELELTLSPGAASPLAVALLQALGFREVLAIDRFVEYYRLDQATVRLEWYPRMDVLLEIEGSPAAIERAVNASGLPRDGFTPEALADFAARYERRTGLRSALTLAELAGERPTWEVG